MDASSEMLHNNPAQTASLGFLHRCIVAPAQWLDRTTLKRRCSAFARRRVKQIPVNETRAVERQPIDDIGELHRVGLDIAGGFRVDEQDVVCFVSTVSGIWVCSLWAIPQSTSGGVKWHIPWQWGPEFPPQLPWQLGIGHFSRISTTTTTQPSRPPQCRTQCPRVLGDHEFYRFWAARMGVRLEVERLNATILAEESSWPAALAHPKHARVDPCLHPVCGGSRVLASNQHVGFPWKKLSSRWEGFERCSTGVLDALQGSRWYHRCPHSRRQSLGKCRTCTRRRGQPAHTCNSHMRADVQHLQLNAPFGLAPWKYCMMGPDRKAEWAEAERVAAQGCSKKKKLEARLLVAYVETSGDSGGS